MHRFLLLFCCAVASISPAFAATVMITAPANGATYAPPASFTVTSSAEVWEDGERVTGHTIYRNGAVIATGTTKSLSAAVSGLAAGTYQFTSSVSTNLGGNASSNVVQVTVAVPGANPPTVSLGAPSGGPWTAPATVGMTATASDSDGSITKVEFYADAVLKGTDTSSPYAYTLSNVSAGAHSLTAKAYDNSGNSTVSAPVNITVAQNPPSVTLAAPTGSPWVAPAAVGLSATASDADGTIAKVEFYANGALKATDTTSPYSYAWASVPAGTYSVTAKAYDNAGNTKTSSVQTVYVAQGSVVRTYTYDTYQQLCRTDEPETGSTFMGYDGAGNLAWSASGYTTATPGCLGSSSVAARRVDRTYDARNRLETLSFPDGLGNQTWAYTADGLPATVITANSGGNTAANTYSYNKRRLLTQETMARNGGTPWYIGYTHDANGNLSRLDYPSNLYVDYAPNALGQPTKVGTYATSVSYFPNGAIKQFTYGNGIVHTLTQNTRGLPDVSRDAYSTTEFLDDGYDYDANGNVAAISDGLPGARGNRTMTYDGLDRLKTTVSPMYSASPASTASYSYDGLDNLTRVVAPGRDHYYCYNANMQLTNVKIGSCSGASVIGISYDAQGNVDNKNGVMYTFDYGNRLRDVPGKESYWYDAYGRRVQANTPSSSYIVSQYSQSGQLLYQQDYRKDQREEYVYLGGSLIANLETPHPAGSATVVKYQHTDALGSPVAVTDASRNVLERNEYEPYGKVLVPAAAKDGPGYTGHVLDAATGMNYMQQRYYDPQIGRFLSVDPVTANSSTGANFNRYWYANNNPYKFNDPDGRHPIAWGAMALGAAIGALIDYVAQKLTNKPGEPINKSRMAISAAGGAFTGGSASVTMAAVRVGTVSVGEAVVVNAAVSGAVGATSAHANSLADTGAMASTETVATSTGLSIAGSLAGSSIGVATGEFAGAATQGQLQRMASSSAPGVPNMASATASTGNAIPTQSGVQSAMSEAGRASVDLGASVAQDELEEK